MIFKKLYSLLRHSLVKLLKHNQAGRKEVLHANVRQGTLEYMFEKANSGFKGWFKITTDEIKR
jgi:hypothetical protein